MSIVDSTASTIDRRFDDVERNVVKLEVTVAETRAELRYEIRKGDEETRDQLKTVIEGLRGDIKLVAEVHLDQDRRIRALEEHP